MRRAGNKKRIREMLGIKQDALALELDLSQQAVSALEQKQALDKEMIEKIAKVLKVTPEAVRSFNEETTIYFISNTFNHHDNSFICGHYTFNPVDKVVELYEALLKSEREKIVLLERILEKQR